MQKQGGIWMSGAGAFTQSLMNRRSPLSTLGSKALINKSWQHWLQKKKMHLRASSPPPSQSFHSLSDELVFSTSFSIKGRKLIGNGWFFFFLCFLLSEDMRSFFPTVKFSHVYYPTFVILAQQILWTGSCWDARDRKRSLHQNKPETSSCAADYFCLEVVFVFFFSFKVQDCSGTDRGDGIPRQRMERTDSPGLSHCSHPAAGRGTETETVQMPLWMHLHERQCPVWECPAGASHLPIRRHLTVSLCYPKLFLCATTLKIHVNDGA